MFNYFQTKKLLSFYKFKIETMKILEVFDFLLEKRTERDLQKLYKVQLPDGSFLSGETSDAKDGVYRYTRGEALKKAIRFGGKVKFDGDYKLVITEIQEFYFQHPDDLKDASREEIEKRVKHLYTDDEPKIETYKVSTCMGKIDNSQFSDTLPFLSNEELEALNEIGYTGKLNSERISRVEYLNSLGKGQFLIEQTKSDEGDFCEEFTITRVPVK